MVSDVGKKVEGIAGINLFYWIINPKDNTTSE